MSDLKTTATADGLELVLTRSGQPELTGSLFNAVYLSLFTPPYWGNAIAERRRRYTSTIPKLTEQGVVTARTARQIATQAEAALAWMIDQTIAEAVDVDVTLRGSGRADMTVRVTEPGGERLDFSYGLNWAATEAEL